MMTLYIYSFLIWFQGTILWGNKTIRIWCVIIRPIHNFCCPHFAIFIKFEDRLVKIWPLDGCSSDLDGGEINRQTVCLFVSPPPRLKLNLDYYASVWLSIFSSTAIWVIWIWRSIALLIFIIAMYFNDIKKTEKFQWPCGLQDFKVS